MSPARARRATCIAVGREAIDAIDITDEEVPLASEDL
jgi:hypothetical protein